MQVAIIAIGTELVEGQTTNRNATWISEKCVDLGLNVIGHLTVADDRAAMKEAYDWASERASLVFVTGGLGPTTDDFTRDTLAEWANLPLEFAPSSWDKIVRRLTQRGIEVAESNRQQCYFPKGANVLENSEGTADAFAFDIETSKRQVHFYVLPGPPREGQAIWKDWIDHDLRSERFSKAGDLSSRTLLYRWQCIGKSESSLGELVEDTLRGFPLKTGYRASMPSVEVKVWVPESIDEKVRSEIQTRLDVALADYCVARDGIDLAAAWTDVVLEKKLEVWIEDRSTLGKLQERIFSELRKRPPELRPLVTIVSQTSGERLRLNDPNSKTSTLEMVLNSSGELRLKTGPHEILITLPNPYPHPQLADRLAGYRAERTLFETLRWLRSIA